MTAAVLSGIDHVYLRRAVTTALDELLYELDARQAEGRCHQDRPCCDQTAALDDVRVARRALTQLYTVTAAVGRAVGEHNGRAHRLLADQTQLLESLGRVLDGVEVDVIRACSHSCPPIPRSTGDTEEAAWHLLDRLEGDGYQIHKPGSAGTWS